MCWRWFWVTWLWTCCGGSRGGWGGGGSGDCRGGGRTNSGDVDNSRGGWGRGNSGGSGNNTDGGAMVVVMMALTLKMGVLIVVV